MGLYAEVECQYGKVQFHTGDDWDNLGLKLGDRVKGEGRNDSEIHWGYGDKHRDGPGGTEYRVVVRNGVVLHVEPVADMRRSKGGWERVEQTHRLAKRFGVPAGVDPVWKMKLKGAFNKWVRRPWVKLVDRFIPGYKERRRKRMAAAAAACIRSKLQESSFARKVLPVDPIPDGVELQPAYDAGDVVDVLQGVGASCGFGKARKEDFGGLANLCRIVKPTPCLICGSTIEPGGAGHIVDTIMLKETNRGVICSADCYEDWPDKVREKVKKGELR